jgi:hypothetical protein
VRVADVVRKIDVDATVRAVGVGRIALGTSYLLAPGMALKLWPGRASTTDADGAMLRMMSRSIGGRDIGLGLGVILAQKHDGPVRGWLEAAMLADVADAVAILLAIKHVPRTRAVLMLGAALGTAAAGRALASAVG